MKTIKIVSFLFLFEFFSALLLKEQTNSIKDDIDKCQYVKDVSTCLSISFESPNYQCCRYKYRNTYEESFPYEEEYCFYMTNPLQPEIDEMKTENGKIVFKEYYGFNMFATPYESNIITSLLNFTCKDGSIDYFYNKSDYTEEEQQLFKSDNYCLRFMFSKTKENATKSACFNSILPTAKKDSGVSCGYYEINLVFNDSTTENIKTCFWFNDDMIKNRKMEFWTKYMLNYYIFSKAKSSKKALSHYEIDLSNSKGKTLRYNSLSDQIDEENPVSGFSYLFSCRYLLILFIILLI